MNTFPKRIWINGSRTTNKRKVNKVADCNRRQREVSCMVGRHSFLRLCPTKLAVFFTNLGKAERWVNLNALEKNSSWVFYIWKRNLFEPALIFKILSGTWVKLLSEITWKELVWAYRDWISTKTDTWKGFKSVPSTAAATYAYRRKTKANTVNPKVFEFRHNTR